MKTQLTNIYARLFSKKPLSKLNKKILLAALKAYGYVNYSNYADSGEDFFLCKVLKPTNPTLCIDVGGHIGHYSERLLENTNAIVYSFEPLVESLRELELRTQRFGERSIHINMGVGSSSGDMTIHFNDDEQCHASFSEDVKRVPYVKNEKTRLIPVVSLDDFIASKGISKVDLIKIDTEGFEMEVLKGAKRTIENLKPRFIQIEYNWHQMFTRTPIFYFSELLSDYDLFQLIPNGWVKRDPKDPLANIFMFSNFVFVRR